MRKIGVALVSLFCFSAPALAVPQAVVDIVQMPAWLDRGGVSRPLAVDMAVKNGDRIRTGRDARVTLKIAEGSTIRLGENAALGFYSLSLRPERLFKGALDVQGGAVRFTTDALKSTRSRRDLSVRAGALTAVPAESGVADLWARTDAERDRVLLVEGRIAVRSGGETVEMAQPMSFLAAPKNAALLPAAQADPGQWAQWLRETEVQPGDGAARRGGRWKVLLASADSEREALLAYDKARAAGYAAQIRPRAGRAGGQWNYEVLLAHLPSEQEAGVVARRVGAELGFKAAPTR